jgi:hypothetical protein
LLPRDAPSTSSLPSIELIEFELSGTQATVMAASGFAVGLML